MGPRITAILGTLREHLEALYGERLARMILFGSQAREDAEPGSDIDVLVVLKGSVDAFEEIERTGDIVPDLSLEEGVTIACVFMSDDEFCQRESPLLLNVRREGVAV